MDGNKINAVIETLRRPRSKSSSTADLGQQWPAMVIKPVEHRRAVTMAIDRLRSVPVCVCVCVCVCSGIWRIDMRMVLLRSSLAIHGTTYIHGTHVYAFARRTPPAAMALRGILVHLVQDAIHCHPLAQLACPHKCAKVHTQQWNHLAVCARRHSNAAE